MKILNTRLATVAALVAGLGIASSAHASWTFTGSTTTSTLSDGAKVATTVYATRDAGSLATDANTSLTISGAYAASTANNGFTSANWVTSTTPLTGQTGATSTGAQLNYYSNAGLGMAADGVLSPNHALDNNGYTEAVLLSFGSSVSLTSIGLGFVSGDADISLFRYTGSTAPAGLSSVGTSLANMNTAGWSLVGNYANLAQDTTNTYNLVNGGTSTGGTSGGTVGSSWWLVTSYNTAYGTGTGLTQGDDYFKMYAVSGVACTASGPTCGGPTTQTGGSAPEPTSLALVAVAGLGFVGARRRALKGSTAA